MTDCCSHWCSFVFLCFIFTLCDCSVMSDVVLFPSTSHNGCSVVVSFMLILENQNTEQQHEQVKQCTAMMGELQLVQKRATKNQTMMTMEVISGSRKWRMIHYNHAHTRRCIQQDYHGPSPIFNHCKLQQC